MNMDLINSSSLKNILKVRSNSEDNKCQDIKSNINPLHYSNSKIEDIKSYLSENVYNPI
jgi:hypothetical protein